MALGWAEAWRRAAARGGLEAGGGLRRAAAWRRRAGGGAAGCVVLVIAESSSGAIWGKLIARFFQNRCVFDGCPFRGVLALITVVI
jgi:hypothetical protein